MTRRERASASILPSRGGRLTHIRGTCGREAWLVPCSVLLFTRVGLPLVSRRARTGGCGRASVDLQAGRVSGGQPARWFSGTWPLFLGSGARAPSGRSPRGLPLPLMLSCRWFFLGKRPCSSRCGTGLHVTCSDDPQMPQGTRGTSAGTSLPRQGPLCVCFLGLGASFWLLVFC